MPENCINRCRYISVFYGCITGAAERGSVDSGGARSEVLFLDTDTLVQQSVLPLFELPAPAGHVAGP